MPRRRRPPGPRSAGRLRRRNPAEALSPTPTASAASSPDRRAKSLETREIESKRRAYQDVDGHESGDGEESTKVGVGEEGAEEGRDVAGAGPVRDVVGSSRIALVQSLFQIVDQVEAHPIVGQPLAALVRCSGRRINRESGHGATD